MSWDEYYEPDDLTRAGPEDDPAVQELEPLLLTLFNDSPQEVYYESQLAVRFEQRYFHWVTVRALKALREANKIGSELQELAANVPLRFYFHRRNRYWKRRAAEIRKLVQSFSDQAFTSALGIQGELLTDAGLPRAGFKPVALNVNSWAERAWQTTRHDLDRIFERDGVYYGTEIKNRLGYIPLEEFRAKLQMCDHLNLTPLFIARMMPKTYIQDVHAAGGFCLLMKYQFYPVSHRPLAIAVRQELKLPVDCPTRLEDGTLERLLRWHEAKIRRAKPRPAI